MTEDIYQPRLLRIAEVIDETRDVRTLRAVPTDGEPLPEFAPGQFALWSAFGEGECPLALTGTPGETDSAACTFKRVGRVTSGLRRLDVGDVVGVRGPFGNGFPLGELDGKDLLLLAGGIGLAALRSLIEYVLSGRERFGTLTLLVGARTPGDLLYRRDWERWREAGVSLVLAVDPGGETPDWKGRVGLVPQVLAELAPSPTHAIALVCGPPVMIRFTLLELETLDFPRRTVYTTLEARMKCGEGKCGHCNIASFYVCRDGTVISAEELVPLPDEL